ncbi:methionyl-tRNA formyltransferase [Candidatus Woesearchaeota archaeon]|jgi:methionyl-tRNA formyltransferase|nr:methionyl-tRNA formyltransferase [Candidatus Woesearchaeota archaeon]MBT6673032.1 methionyl-tRNA formyltransferase [Lentimicrobiaceae bacterium]
MKKMKIIYVSFNDEGWVCLKKMLELNGNVAGIFTLKDDLRIKMSGNKPFDDLAAEYKIPLYKIKNINDDDTLKIIKIIAPDIAFVIGWSQLVKRKFFTLCRNNCIGIHPTMLPKHRGRAPLTWAIVFGLRKTGVTMFYLGEDADNGDIIGQLDVEITRSDNAGSLYQKVLDAHVILMEKYFPLILNGEVLRMKQDEQRSSYWTKRIPGDGIIDWNTCAYNLYDWIRALSDPYPGAFTFCGKKKLFIWEGKLINITERSNASGEILNIDKEGITVSTGEGLLKLTCVQIAGNKRLECSDILKSHFFQIGIRLG